MLSSQHLLAEVACRGDHGVDNDHDLLEGIGDVQDQLEFTKKNLEIKFKKISNFFFLVRICN